MTCDAQANGLTGLLVHSWSGYFVTSAVQVHRLTYLLSHPLVRVPCDLLSSGVWADRSSSPSRSLVYSVTLMFRCVGLTDLQEHAVIWYTL
jgi:hypothetical protein